MTATQTPRLTAAALAQTPKTCEAPRCASTDIHAQEFCKRHYQKFLRSELITPQLVDAGPTRHRIQAHLDRHRTLWALAQLIHGDHASLRLIVDGTTRRVRTNTAARIAAVPLPPTTIGTVRRVRALARAGWSLRDVRRVTTKRPRATGRATRPTEVAAA